MTNNKQQISPKYVFYSVIGRHAGESVSQIINRKQLEIKECGYSLWSVSIDQMSKRLVWGLDNDDRVLVLCKISTNAKDPVIQNKIISAQTMIGPAGINTIPPGINTTFTQGKKYQAYVVNKYIILDSPKFFDFGSYESIQANGVVKSFKNRFKCGQFQNTFGRFNDKLNESCEKPIGVIMELRYPFVVDIAE